MTKETIVSYDTQTDARLNAQEHAAINLHAAVSVANAALLILMSQRAKILTAHCESWWKGVCYRVSPRRSLPALAKRSG